MTSAEEHVDAVGRAVDAEAVLGEDHPAAVGRLQRLCRAAVRDLQASGVGVSVLSEAGDVLTAASSDPLSIVLEELQFTLGEGPCLAAYATRLPVLVPDLEEAALSTFPAYAPAALDHGISAVFAFPLAIGAARLGALDVYRLQPGRLSAWTVTRALTYADAALRTVLDAQQDGDSMAALLADGSESRLEVYQAQGMVMIQLGLSPEDAMLRIRAHAFGSDRRVVDVATDIITRRLRLEPDDAR